MIGMDMCTRTERPLYRHRVLWYNRQTLGVTNVVVGNPNVDPAGGGGEGTGQQRDTLVKGGQDEPERVTENPPHSPSNPHKWPSPYPTTNRRQTTSFIPQYNPHCMNAL